MAITVQLNIDAEQLKRRAQAAAKNFEALMRDYMPRLVSIYANAAYEYTPPFGKKIPTKYDYAQAIPVYPGPKLRPEQWREWRHLMKAAGPGKVAVKVKKRPKTTKGTDIWLTVKAGTDPMKNAAVKQAAWIRTRGTAKLGWLRGLSAAGGTPLPQAQTLIRKRPEAWAHASGSWRLTFSAGLAEAEVTYGAPSYLNESVVRYAMGKAEAKAQASVDNFMQRLLDRPL